MAFQVEKFNQTKFEKRTEEVPVPALAVWFDEGDRAVFEVRGLTGMDLARANEAEEAARTRETIAEGLLAGTAREKAEAVKQLLGITDDVPGNLVKRIEIALLGIVEPKVDREFVVRFAERFPIEFWQVTNRITALTGMGQTWGKSLRSGETPASEQP